MLRSAKQGGFLLLLVTTAALFGSVTAQSCGCTADETCCQDDTGFACCIDQTTYCVPQETGQKAYPARCCPQWTVGCFVGSVGCCDPARPWQRVLALDAPQHTVTPGKPSKRIGYVAQGGSGALPATVYALFTSSSLAANADLNALTIDVATGAITKNVKLTGPAAAWDAKTYGEQTRVFPFAHAANKFFWFDVKAQPSSATTPIMLYLANPADGSSSAATVTGAQGNVIGMGYHVESGKAVLTTGAKDGSAFRFYSVDLTTAAATPLGVDGTVSRGTGESDPAFYSGYVSAVGEQITTAYRLGYEVVTQGTGPGLGVTDLSATSANATTWASVPTASKHEFFYSLSRKQGGATFLSLAPSDALNHTLAVVEWTAAGDARVVLDVPDAHPPEDKRTGILGYVAADTVASAWVGLVIKENPSVLPGRKNQWEILGVDLDSATGGSMPIVGKGFDLLGAETISVSGVGIKQ